MDSPPALVIGGCLFMRCMHRDSARSFKHRDAATFSIKYKGGGGGGGRCFTVCALYIHPNIEENAVHIPTFPSRRALYAREAACLTVCERVVHGAARARGEAFVAMKLGRSARLPIGCRAAGPLHQQPTSQGRSRQQTQDSS